MTAEAPSAMTADEAPKSVVDASSTRRGELAPEIGSDGATVPGSNGSASNGNGVHPEDASRDGTAADAGVDVASREPAEAGDVDAPAAEPPGGPEASADAATSAVESDATPAAPFVAGSVAGSDAGSDAGSAAGSAATPFVPSAAGSAATSAGEGAHARTAVSDDAATPDAATADSVPRHANGRDPSSRPDGQAHSSWSDDAVAHDAVTDGAVGTTTVEDADLGTADGDEPMADEVVAEQVAEQLGTAVGDGVEADPAEFAAAAVLDVLRASGWADAAEAAELRAEATRTRELLSEVIRDHRAREASAVGVENQQLHWLVPLLRAAHGVAFGSLGAKVALRTAVQEVPPEVLAQAGLRIDYGVEPDYQDERPT